jgi:hypothetical protein
MINKVINRIKSVDLTNDFAYEELFFVFSQIESLPCYSYTISKELNLGFYRSRKNDCFVNYIDFGELSYPPANKVTEYSRANKPVQNLFYISDRWSTNLMELKLFWAKDLLDKDIFWVTTGKWDLIEDIKVIIIPDFYNASMKQFIGRLSSELEQSQLDFLRFINDLFKIQAYDNKNLYKLTSAFCNSLIYSHIRSNQKIDGILFTSVQDGRGFNLALNPLTVDSRKFKLNSVIKHLLRKTTGSNNKPKIDNYNTPIFAERLDYDKEKIIWKE